VIGNLHEHFAVNLSSIVSMSTVIRPRVVLPVPDRTLLPAQPSQFYINIDLCRNKWYILKKCGRKTSFQSSV
jgi:hypothetical protein